MGSGKHSGSSETSSEEIDQPEKATAMNISDDNAGVGRSYECTFCKRGFTNAQALGGHMNIHRKDKAKAKQKNTATANNKSLEDHTSSYANNTFAAHDSQRAYTTAMAAYMSYQLYFPSSNDVPTYLNGYNNTQYYDHNCDASGSLSLSIRPPPHRADGDERGIVRNDAEVDLELRLGHHP